MSQRAVVDETTFVTDWEAGIPLAVMAETYGISDSTVSKVAKRMGLDARRSRWPGRNVTYPGYALTGGQWVPDRRGVLVWVSHP